MILERPDLKVLREATVSLDAANAKGIDLDDNVKAINLTQADTFALMLEGGIAGRRARSIAVLPVGSATALDTNYLVAALRAMADSLENLERNGTPA